MVILFSLLPGPLGRLERAGVREKIGDVVVTNKISRKSWDGRSTLLCILQLYNRPLYDIFTSGRLVCNSCSLEAMPTSASSTVRPSNVTKTARKETIYASYASRHLASSLPVVSRSHSGYPEATKSAPRSSFGHQTETLVRISKCSRKQPS